MKGYVSVTFTDKQKQELFDLYNKINEFNKKHKSEVFGWNTITVDKSFLWWKWQSEIKFWEFQCPEELKPFFFDKVTDQKYYYFTPTATTDALASIVSLVKSGNPVFLGDELAGVYNWLIETGYISTDIPDAQTSI